MVNGAPSESHVEQFVQLICSAVVVPVYKLPDLVSGTYSSENTNAGGIGNIPYTKVDPECPGLKIEARVGEDPTTIFKLGDWYRIRIAEPKVVEGWISRSDTCHRSAAAEPDSSDSSQPSIWPICYTMYAASKPDASVKTDLADLPVEVPQLDTTGTPDLAISFRYEEPSRGACRQPGETLYDYPVFTLTNRGSAASPKDIKLKIDGKIEKPVLFRGLEPGESIPVSADRSVIVDPANEIAELSESNNSAKPRRGKAWICGAATPGG